MGIINKFSLDSIKFGLSIAFCLLVIWVAVALCAVCSVNETIRSPKARIAWMVFILAVPVVGLLAYLPFSTEKVDGFLFNFYRQKKRD